MQRIRTIKPDFFKHEPLFDLEVNTGLPVRLAFSGLWTCCDREGRFKWRPRELKANVMPHDNVDFVSIMEALLKERFVLKYRVDGEDYGYIPSWKKHQVINNKESKSIIPPPPESFCLEIVDAKATREERDGDTTVTPLEGKGKEGKGREDIQTADFKPSECTPVIRKALGISGQKNWITATEAIEAHMLANPGTPAMKSAEEIARLWPIYRASPKGKKFPMNPEKWLTSGEFLRQENWTLVEAGESPPKVAVATSTDATDLIRERQQKLKEFRASNGKA